MRMLNPALARVLKRLHYPRDIILTCVRWYVAYPLSLRNLEDMMAGRGVSVDHSTVHRWAVKLLPVLEKAFACASGRLARAGAWTRRTFASRADGDIFTGPSTRTETPSIFCYAPTGTRLQSDVTLRNRSPRKVRPGR
ncbi:hypothetical protein P3T25_009126 [Paraburkholderia sp. GAS32]